MLRIAVVEQIFGAEIAHRAVRAFVLRNDLAVLDARIFKLHFDLAQIHTDFGKRFGREGRAVKIPRRDPFRSAVVLVKGKLHHRTVGNRKAF